MTDSSSSNTQEFTTRYGALDGAKQNIVRNLLWVISEKTGQGLCMCVHTAMCCVETHILPLLKLLSSSVHISNIADETDETEPTKKQYTFTWTLGDFFVPEFIIQESNAQWDQWASLMSLEDTDDEGEDV
jgi:hypothetical protein